MRLLQLTVMGAIIICSIVNVQAETITQKEFLDQLAKSHPLFAKEKLSKEILIEQKEELRSVSDWKFNSSAIYNHEEPSFAFTGPERTDAFQLRGAVDKHSWNNGSTFSASFVTTRVDMKIDPMFGVPDNFYENIVSLSYSVPLKKNKGGFLNRLAYDLKQYDIDISDLVSLENQENFLSFYSLKYLEWAFLLEEKKIIQQRLKLSEELLKNTKEKRDANLVDEVDVIRSEDAVLLAQQNLMLIEARVASLKSELAEITQDNRYLSLFPEFKFYQFDIPGPLDESVEYLHENARTIKNLLIRVEQLKYYQKGNLEHTKSDLTLFTELKMKNADEGISNSFEIDKPNIMIGLKYAFPFGHREAKSRIAQTELEIEQLSKQIEEIRLSLISSLISINKEITELKKVLDLNKLQIESAQNKTEEELKLYHQGRGQMTFVIQSRDSEQAAKLAYAENAFNYHILKLQLLELTDQLYKPEM